MKTIARDPFADASILAGLVATTAVAVAGDVIVCRADVVARVRRVRIKLST